MNNTQIRELRELRRKNNLCLDDVKDYVKEHCEEAKPVSMMHGHNWTIDCKLAEGWYRFGCPVIYGKTCIKYLTKAEKKRLQKGEKDGGEDYPEQPPYFCGDGRMH